jgi:hypothetical protein
MFVTDQPRPPGRRPTIHRRVPHMCPAKRNCTSSGIAGVACHSWSAVGAEGAPGPGQLPGLQRRRRISWGIVWAGSRNVGQVNEHSQQHNDADAQPRLSTSLRGPRPPNTASASGGLRLAEIVACNNEQHKRLARPPAAVASPSPTPRALHFRLEGGEGGVYEREAGGGKAGCGEEEMTERGEGRGWHSGRAVEGSGRWRRDVGWRGVGGGGG